MPKERSMKEKITLDQAKGMTWGEVMSYYFEGVPLKGLDILWNETCYPFDTERTLDQIYEYYLKTVKI